MSLQLSLHQMGTAMSQACPSSPLPQALSLERVQEPRAANKGLQEAVTWQESIW